MPATIHSPATLHRAPEFAAHEAERRTSVRLLLIGYGNPLIGDDALGPRIAETVASWDQPGVRALSCHQLTPESAAELAEAEEVVFVGVAPHAERVTLLPLAAAPTAHYTYGHAMAPGVLLALTRTLHGHSPPAWMLSVPAVSFMLGRPLSTTALRGEKAALKLLREFSH